MAGAQEGSGGRRDGLVVTVGSDGTWSFLSGRMRPEDWITEKAEPDIPHSVLAAESERNSDGGFGYQAG
jgi:hypothetical protein